MWCFDDCCVTINDGVFIVTPVDGEPMYYIPEDETDADLMVLSMDRGFSPLKEREI